MQLPPSENNREKAIRRQVFALFIFSNLAVICAVYPVAYLLTAPLLWKDTFSSALILATISLLHLTFFWGVSIAFGWARPFFVPFVLSCCFLFLSNRHMQGQIPDGPFGDELSSVDQHVWGIGYLRVFDRQFGQFGKFHFDWHQFFTSFEMSIALTLILAAVSYLLLAAYRLLRGRATTEAGWDR